MRLPIQRLVILLLCCLLPVQGALALARSVGMISHHSSVLRVEFVNPVAEHPPAVEDHSLHAHAHHHAATSVSTESVKLRQHSQSACPDCSKCCMAGAAAPPPAAIPSAAVAVTLNTARTAPPEAAGHIPEKPERPPRPCAALTT